MWHNLTIEEICEKLSTNIKKGISKKESEKRIKKIGLNKLNDKPSISIFARFINQFKDFMVITLLISAIISALASKLQNSSDYIDSVIIISIVCFNALLGVIQESKAEKSIDALKKMFSPQSKVLRDGNITSIPSENLTIGDIVILETGCLVPADIRLISCNNLQVDESSLTGEALPIQKEAMYKMKLDTPLADISNMVFASSTVVNGNATGIVVDVGMNTRVGKIAKMIITSDDEMTPLQKKLSNVGKVLGIVALCICLVIFILGVFKNLSIFEMFMTSVGLAVAAIPEGLPAIVTIILSVGITKMAKKNAIVRKLPAVETLGCSNIICSDKTGTLTQNKMTIVESTIPNKTLLEYASLCTNVKNIKTNNGMELSGLPTEMAIYNYAKFSNILPNIIKAKYPRIDEIPFDSSRKLMSVVVQKDGKYLIITKGAPDILLNLCSHKYENGSISEMYYSDKQNILKENEEMANKALRVIAVAYKECTSKPDITSISCIENDLTFAGLLGMIDPPREGVKESIKTCITAGIKVVMITGDHIFTATAIAKNLGILRENDLAITGKELDNMSDNLLRKNIMKYSVFARVTPEHKVRIVKAFKSQNKVVAMTGDGVNDAPALKNADIGIAMGMSGSDVAKNAADIVLTDDNFVTITEAVKEGRHIYANIRKAIHFLIATNIGEIVTIFFAILLGMKSPLLAIHLLWINLITDSLPAIALGLEKCDKNIMNKEPINSKKGFFSDGLGIKIVTQGILIGFLDLALFYIGETNYDLITGRTMAFVGLGTLELVQAYNLKSNDSIFKYSPFDNLWLTLAIIFGIALQVVVVLSPTLANIFDVVVLTKSQWIITICISLIPIIYMEICKVFYRKEDKTSKKISINEFMHM